jgi:hypothetical protein
MLFTEDGHFEGHAELPPEVLDELHVTLIADYQTFLAGEVVEEDLADFLLLAEENELGVEVRRDFDLIKINGYSFSSFDDGPELPANLRIDSYDGGLGLYLVQLKSPATSEWLAGLRSIGSILSYYPQNTFLVRMSHDDSEQCRHLDAAQHVSLYQPAYKIPGVLLDADRPVKVSLRLDDDRDLSAVVSFLGDMTSGDIDVRHGTIIVELNVDEIILSAKRPEVLWMEPLNSIEFSGERQAMVVAGLHNGTRPDDPEPGATHDGYEEWILDKGFCTPDSAPSGCYPYWTKVGVFDSGLNTMVCSSSNYDNQTGICSSWSTNHDHPDLDHSSNLQSACGGLSSDCYDPVLKRFFCAEDWSGNNQCLDSSDFTFSDEQSSAGGHGTAAISIIASTPNTSPIEQDDADYFLGTGIAPSAQIVVAKFSGSVYQGGGSSDSGMSELQYEDLMALVEATGARFASNSWNLKYNTPWYDPTDPKTSLPYTAYTGFSEMADELVRDGSGGFDGHDDPITIVFSSGNVPNSTNPWATSPGNAKNVISVGATRGWSTTGSAGAAHSGCQDLNHDIEDICGGAGWHSRRLYIGEDDSGDDLPRFKPDLVAPGSQIVAARAQDSSFVDYYTCFRGTSAAAPAITAAAILADAWYYWVISGATATPSPAMVKAMLVAHADDMYGGYDYLSSSTIPHSPSPEQGWGRVNLDGLFQEDVEVTVYDEDHGSTPTRRFTDAGDYWSVQLEADGDNKPIIAVMTFTDAASSPTGSGWLVVNNLDMIIVKPGNKLTMKTYWSNRFASNSWYSQQYGAALPVFQGSEHNNVKVIRIPAGALTTPFTLKVRAQTINALAVPGISGETENQDFALYVNNAVPAP